jgi:hypothetical protein
VSHRTNSRSRYPHDSKQCTYSTNTYTLLLRACCHHERCALQKKIFGDARTVYVFELYLQYWNGAGVHVRVAKAHWEAGRGTDCNFTRIRMLVRILLPVFGVKTYLFIYVSVRGQTGQVLYWESGFSFVFLICRATYVSPYVAIFPCVCVRLFMCHARLLHFFLNILFSNSIFYVNTFYVSDF